MRVTVKEIGEAWNVLDKLVDQTLPPAFGVKFARMHKALKPYREQSMELVRAKIHPLLQMGEDGQPLRDDKGALLFKEGITIADLDAARAVVDTTEIDVDIEPLETRPVPNLRLTPRQIEELEPFVIFI